MINHDYILDEKGRSKNWIFYGVLMDLATKKQPIRTAYFKTY
jgi:hypothetical protein